MGLLLFFAILLSLIGLINQDDDDPAVIQIINFRAYKVSVIHINFNLSQFPQHAVFLNPQTCAHVSG